MAAKSERVMEYIARLSPGEKVSVRRLAQDLGVSQGTAYKSIKAAEDQGLVTTRPKVGTVRINLRSAPNREDDTLAEAARCVGASCLCGLEAARERPLAAVVVADGSLEQFTDALRRRPPPLLCLVGDRPELQRRALTLGADLLLTGGSALDETLMDLARSSGLAVFSSKQDSFTLLGMLERRMPRGLPRRTMAQVRDWMQLPRYLYHDDMVTQWHRMYTDIFYDGASCPVVDDRLRICGTVDAQTAMNAAPALRLSEIMDEPEEGSVVDEEMDMEELAERMLRTSRHFSAVSSRDGMSGYISLEDLIRYYQYNQSYSQFDRNEEGSIQLSTDDQEQQRRFYTVRLETVGAENKRLCVRFVFSAAAWHAYDLLGSAVDFENGTFYAPHPLKEPGEYMISSEVLKLTGQSLVLELEMFNDATSYLKCTLNVSPSREAESGETQYK